MYGYGSYSRPGTAAGALGGGMRNGLQMVSGGRPGTASFPNLPGYRRPGIDGDTRREKFYQDPQKKAQSLHFVNGIPMVKSSLSSRPQTASIDDLASLNQTQMPRDANQFSDLSGRYSLAKQRRDRENLAKISSNMSVSKIGRRTVPAITTLSMKSSNSYVNDNNSVSTWGGNFNDDASSVVSAYPSHDNTTPLPPVLLFYGYYFEDIIESNMESKRIHRCELYFYTEDGSIEIIECKQENSGMPQGNVLRRRKVEKRGGEFVGINDMKMGGVVEIYSRGYSIIGCNDSTLRFVRTNMNWTEEELRQGRWPDDEFIKKNREKMMRETGTPGVNRNRKMHEMKEYMEALLGKPKAMSDLGAFLEVGNKTLCFDIVWDDTERLYGDVRLFKLCYFLSDDTLEIVPVHTRNDGRDQFPKLLKRSKVPKDIRNPSGAFYTWRDFKIGGIINVYQRAMTIAKADKFTRDFYVNKGVNIGRDIELIRGPDVKYERQIPPYNGFGSEEDSLRSCTGSIRPGVAKKHFHYDKRGHITRFNAKLLTNKNDDKVRRFVIQYFLEDDTVAVREPPLRNSGIVGGQFLRRQPMKHSDGTKVLAGDLYVGGILNLNCHKFLLLDADEGTYRLMENDPATFPLSNYEGLHKLLREYRGMIKGYFVKESSNGNDRQLDFAGLRACMVDVGLGKLKKQELITIWRKLDRKGKGKVSWMKLVKVAEDKPIHVTIQSHRESLAQAYQD
ncbi:hypothetical protein TrRE_jg13361 [Triparma retinervis]|uniref:EF-hand domain-containing family member C2 n=1 Tax=Triparma retinervis TaxID=2557542 RepID=A0A9W7G4R6_9STRA|nr:hypothetical protein TrRE_jg13361 [Triparma retinervis]